MINDGGLVPVATRYIEKHTQKNTTATERMTEREPSFYSPESSSSVRFEDFLSSFCSPCLSLPLWQCFWSSRAIRGLATLNMSVFLLPLLYTVIL